MPTAETARQFAARLIVAAHIKKSVLEYEGTLKANAADYMDPGDRKMAKLPDGTPIGTVSYVKGRERYTITDERAFTNWCIQYRPSAVVTTVRDSDRRSILLGIKEDGEIPDGVTVTQGDPYVAVRQSPEQREAVNEAYRRGDLTHLIPDTYATKELPA